MCARSHHALKATHLQRPRRPAPALPITTTTLVVVVERECWRGGERVENLGEQRAGEAVGLLRVCFVLGVVVCKF